MIIALLLSSQFWSKAVGLEAPPEELDPTMALIIGDGSKRARSEAVLFL